MATIIFCSKKNLERICMSETTSFVSLQLFSIQQIKIAARVLSGHN